MTTAQLISNIRTILRSWTRKFIKAIEGRTDLSLIGQFYVAFSVFFITDKAAATSKHNDDD
jgi:HSP90 family molecular chaperone